MLGCPYVTPTEAPKGLLCLYGDPHISGGVNDWLSVRRGISLNPDLHICTGDLTYNGESANWLLVDAGWAEVEAAGQQYLITTGNHDTLYDHLVRMGPWCLSEFDTIFAVARMSWVQGHYTESHGRENARNAWFTKRIVGRDFLFLSLEYGRTYPIMVWADAVVKAHPNHQVVIVTHDHLYKTGAIFDATVDTGEALSWNPAAQTVVYPNGYDDIMDGKELWTRALPNSPNGFLTDNTNIRILICGHSFPGHFGKSTTRAGGSKIHEILVNNQDVAGSWFKTLELDFSRDMIVIRSMDGSGATQAGTSLTMTNSNSGYDFAIVNAGIK